jgi:hypothetical protein
MPAPMCRMDELGLPTWCADYPWYSDGYYKQIAWFPKKLYTRGQMKAAAAAEFGYDFRDVRVTTVWGKQEQTPDWSMVECKQDDEGAVEMWRCECSDGWDRQQLARFAAERAERNLR